VTRTRIAFLDHAPFIGGAETVLLDVIAHLDRSRFDPIVFTPSDSPFAASLDTHRIPWIDLPMPRINSLSLLTPLRWWSTSRELAHLVRKHHIDLIHANTVRAHLISAFMQHQPVVWMLHDDTFPLWLIRRLHDRPARLIANSYNTAQYYELQDDPRTIVIHNGVDTQATYGNGFRFRRRIGIGPDEILVAHVGRLVRWKGQHLFIRAASHIARHYRHVHFVLVGTHSDTDNVNSVLGGGTTFLNELKRLADTWGLNSRITFAGYQDDMADVYAGIDLLIHSSTRPEPFGRVLIEAMAAGVPVIASAQGGPTEIVQDGVTGLLITPGSSEILSEAMHILLEDSERRKVMGIAACQRAREAFDIRQQVERIQSVYDEVLGR
jgi:glycosyltransferase involved in cell wall biosynthesis